MRFEKNFYTQSYRQIFNRWNYSHLVAEPLFITCKQNSRERYHLPPLCVPNDLTLGHSEPGMFWKWTVIFSLCFSWDCCILFQSQFCCDGMQTISYNTIVGGPDFECLYRSISHHSQGYLFTISLTKVHYFINEGFLRKENDKHFEKR